MFSFSHLQLLFCRYPVGGAEQMAIDELLLARVALPTLRIYCWDRARKGEAGKRLGCVTFGYFQRLHEVQQLFPERELVRRWSGGGVVDHTDDVTFSFLIPAGEGAAQVAPRSFYQELHQFFLEEIAAWGEKEVFSLKVERCDSGEKERKKGASHNLQLCFEQPSCDDLLVGSQKILGGAQRRARGALLYQGSLQWYPTSVQQADDNWQESFFIDLGRRLLGEEGRLLLKEESDLMNDGWEEELQLLLRERYQNEKWLCRKL